MSIRDDLITEVKTTLSGIGGTGYNLTVKTVTDRLDSIEKFDTEQFSLLFVTDGDEIKDDDDVDGLDCSLDINILGIVKESHSDQDLQAESRKLMADVEKALCVDRFRNGKAYNTVVVRIKGDRAAFRPYGLFDMTAKINYKQTYGTP